MKPKAWRGKPDAMAGLPRRIIKVHSPCRIARSLNKVGVLMNVKRANVFLVLSEALPGSNQLFSLVCHTIPRVFISLTSRHVEHLHTRFSTFTCVQTIYVVLRYCLYRRPSG